MRDVLKSKSSGNIRCLNKKRVNDFHYIISQQHCKLSFIGSRAGLFSRVVELRRNSYFESNAPTQREQTTDRENKADVICDISRAKKMGLIFNMGTSSSLGEPEEWEKAERKMIQQITSARAKESYHRQKLFLFVSFHGQSCPQYVRKLAKNVFSFEI